MLKKLNTLKERLQNQKGFTLIELIVVIAIIAILAAVLIPRFTGFTENARQKAAISETRNVLLSYQALESQGADAITITDINTYAGSSYAGTLDPADLVDADGDFTYEIDIDNDTYTVDVANYVIDTDFAPSSGTGSLSTGLD